MINNSKDKNVLKGQHNLTQGKRRRSVALGCRMGIKIVRGEKFIHENFLFRTKWNISFSLHMMSLNSVQRKVSALFNILALTVLVGYPIPRAKLREERTETTPWADIYWPFRPEKHVCIRSGFPSKREGSLTAEFEVSN